jgi:hypothetical protein
LTRGKEPPHCLRQGKLRVEERRLKAGGSLKGLPHKAAEPEPKVWRMLSSKQADRGVGPRTRAHTRKIHGQGTGVIGMKLIGEGRFTKPEEREASIRFVMGLGSVDAITIGFKITAEVDEAIERIDRALNA